MTSTTAGAHPFRVSIHPSTAPSPRLDRWERQTGDWLALFLEPLLAG
jgi:hypothetical protein